MKLYLKRNIVFPGGEIDLPEERILLPPSGFVTFPWESIPNWTPYVIGHEFGPLVCLWSVSSHDALNDGLDAGMLDAFLLDEALAEEMTDEDGNEDFARLGNADEPCDLTYAWIAEVDLQDPRNLEFFVRTAEARCLAEHVDPDIESLADAVNVA